jgi:hypothetical protein
LYNLKNGCSNAVTYKPVLTLPHLARWMLVAKSRHPRAPKQNRRLALSPISMAIICYTLGCPVQLQSVSSFGMEDVDRKLNVALSCAKEFIILTGTEGAMRQ